MRIQPEFSPTLAESAVMTKAPVKLTGELPQMVVFDLDYTLWDAWCDTHVTPPLLRRHGDINQVHDRHGQGLGFYPDVPDILLQLHHTEIHVAAASRTHAPKVARQILSELTLNGSRRDASRNPLKSKDTGSKGTVSAIQLFDSMEIYPGSKLEHFRELHRQTGIPYEEMVRVAFPHRSVFGAEQQESGTDSRHYTTGLFSSSLTVCT